MPTTVADLVPFAAIGDLIGQSVFDVQKIVGEAFAAAHTPPGGPLPDAATSAAFALQMTKLMGEAFLQHVPAYGGTVTSAPNTGAGLDLPVPSVVMQVDGGGAFVELWWKTSNANATDWRPLGGANWEQIAVDPSAGAGLDRAVRTIVWQNNTATPALPIALWIKTGTGATAWEKLWPASGSDPTVATLTADPTSTATAGVTGKLGTYLGELFIHLDDASNTEWLNLSSLLPSYTPTFADLTEGELAITMTMTDATVLTVVKTATQIRAAAIDQSVGGVSNALLFFPSSDLAGVTGKTLAGGVVPISVVASVPFRANGGLGQTASRTVCIYIDYNPEVTYPVTLDGAPTNQTPATAWTFLTGDFLQIEFDLHGMSRF